MESRFNTSLVGVGALGGVLKEVLQLTEGAPRLLSSDVGLCVLRDQFASERCFCGLV